MNIKRNFIAASLILILATLSTGCFAPINSTFEGAKMLDKGEIELQGNYSKYYFLIADNAEEEVNINNNFGVGIGYGVSDRYNMKFRYERINTWEEEIEWFDDEKVIVGGGLNYFELGGKFQLKKDKTALSIPLGIYLMEEATLFSLDPRFFWTIIGNEKFELNLIPKAHILIGDGIGLMPGISLGFGFSNDLDKWAIRPEISYDRFFTFGIGATFNIKTD